MECDPSLAEAYYYRGVVHQRWGAADRAIEDYLKASELDPERIAYLLAAAEMMVTGRRLDEARDLLLPKLAYFEHNAAVHELLGDIASLQENHRAAARSYERSMMIDPEAPLVGEKAVGSMFRAGEWQRCLEAARRLRVRAMEGADGRLVVVPADILRHEGRSLAMLGRYQEARGVFAEYARQYPEDTEAWRDLATASLALDELYRAQWAAERLVTLARDEPAGYTLRGIVAERAHFGGLKVAVFKVPRCVRCDRLQREQREQAPQHRAHGVILGGRRSPRRSVIRIALGGGDREVDERVLHDQDGGKPVGARSRLALQLAGDPVP